MKLSNRLNFPLISMAKILEGKKLSLSLAKRLADKVKRLKIKLYLPNRIPKSFPFLPKMLLIMSKIKQFILI